MEDKNHVSRTESKTEWIYKNSETPFWKFNHKSVENI